MIKNLLLAGALVACLSTPALAARAGTTGFGPRVGFSVDPDQLVLGGHVVVADIAEDINFVPNLELGFGDRLTVIAFNLDLHYRFAIEGSAWTPYAGAGVGVNIVDRDSPAKVSGGSSTEVGGNLIVGAGIPTVSGNRFFGELKLGLGDIPTLKLMVGWNLR